MSKFVGVRFNDEEEAILYRAMAAYGDDQMSAHLKRVYFDALKPNAQVLDGIRSELERMSSLLEDFKQSENGHTDSAMLLSIVCGLYVMVRKSVNDSIRSQADKMLDVTAIEGYLRGK